MSELQKRADERLDRFFASGLTALLTLITWRFLGPWIAWGYMIGQFVLAGIFGIYAYGLSRRDDD